MEPNNARLLILVIVLIPIGSRVSIPRFILTPQEVNAPCIFINGADAAHARILRLMVNDQVVVADGEGKEYYARIVSLQKKQIELERLEQLERVVESPLRLTLYQGVTKGEKWEWVIQKTTELGIDTLVPVYTEFSQVKPRDGRDARKQRWHEIARQAARQSGRTRIPAILEPLTFIKSLETATAAVRLIFHEAVGRHNYWPRLPVASVGSAGVGLWIGPEGGFSESEIEQAQAHQAGLVGLGPRVLRAETASLVAVTLAQFHWGDLAGIKGV